MPGTSHFSDLEHFQPCVCPDRHRAPQPVTEPNRSRSPPWTDYLWISSIPAFTPDFGPPKPWSFASVPSGLGPDLVKSGDPGAILDFPIFDFEKYHSIFAEHHPKPDFQKWWHFSIVFGWWPLGRMLSWACFVLLTIFAPSRTSIFSAAFYALEFRYSGSHIQSHNFSSASAATEMWLVIIVWLSNFYFGLFCFFPSPSAQFVDFEGDESTISETTRIAQYPSLYFRFQLSSDGPVWYNNHQNHSSNCHFCCWIHGIDPYAIHPQPAILILRWSPILGLGWHHQEETYPDYVFHSSMSNPTSFVWYST